MWFKNEMTLKLECGLKMKGR